MENNIENPEPDEDSGSQQEFPNRNANDNFNDDQIDDYGIDYSKPGAEEELQERVEIKGGTGSHGKERNRNYDFKEEDEAWFRLHHRAV